MNKPGQSVAGVGSTTPVKGGGHNLGKKTWTPMEKDCGYSNRSVSEYKGAPGQRQLANGDESRSGSQKVKGQGKGKRAPAEAKPVSGKDMG